MSTITYGAEFGARADLGAVPVRTARKSWLRRLLTALQEAQMRRVEQELRRCRHLLPEELDWAAFKLGPKSEDQLPFLRRD